MAVLINILPTLGEKIGIAARFRTAAMNFYQSADNIGLAVIPARPAHGAPPPAIGVEKIKVRMLLQFADLDGRIAPMAAPFEKVEKEPMAARSGHAGCIAEGPFLCPHTEKHEWRQQLIDDTLALGPDSRPAPSLD